MAESGDQPSISGSDTILLSAPGKVILHGEHAVVYGKMALAAGLNLRSFLRLSNHRGTQVCLHLPDINLEGQWDVQRLLQVFSDLLQQDVKDCLPATPEVVQRLRLFAGYPVEDSTKTMAVIAFLYLYLRIAGRSGHLPILDVLVSSSLPPGAGLGSSAAYSVCLTAGLLTFVKAVTPVRKSSDHWSWSRPDLDLINKWAYEAERLIHGNPSGIDNAVSVYGGAIRYKSKVISPLDGMPQLSILLVNTRVPRSTKVLVAGVRERHDKYPNIYGPIMESIEQISLECEKILKVITASQSEGADLKSDQSQHFKELENLIDVNQQLLDILGVSHPAIDNVSRSALAYDIHAKLTGAGGGGCAFALLPPYISKDSVTSLQKDLHLRRYDSWVTSFGANGVMMHRSVECLREDGYLLPKSFVE